ncbi:MAG TPA: hypothetical protein VEJ18_02825, partial [Planctomycetota bacterium]|nr:hypothetical protein [Planctomycetota bacterium]
QEVHALEGVPLQKGLALLNEGRLADARRILEGVDGAEALYHVAAIDAWEGHDPEPRLRQVVARYPETRWGWRAAANLARGRDGALSGPMARMYEPFFRAAGPSKELDSTVRRAVDMLLRMQRRDGSWTDARFPFSANAQVLPNYWVVATALAARALAEWREIDPARIDEALARADRWLLDDRRTSRGADIEIYADAYRLFYFTFTKDVPAMNRIVRNIAGLQQSSGYWAHTYPNSFTTAAVVHHLAAARRAGADVPSAILDRAANALESAMGPGGRVAYNAARMPSSEKDSMARRGLCALALLECGRGTPPEVEAGLNYFWKHYARLEAVRVCDFHADGELGGFTYFYGLFYAAEALETLDEPSRRVHAAKIRERVLALPEPDGTFADSPDLGKSYGTARALLILRRVR